MNTDLRIPVTADQKLAIMSAVADEPGGFAAWARDVLLKAAAERIALRPKMADGKPRGNRRVS
jgi:hypothetical protein